MTQRRLFYLDANRLSAYRWQAGHVTAEESFSADSQGLESFHEYLVRHRQSIFYLLADVVDEGYQLDVVPHVQGSDRTALLKRKLDQYFYGTPLSLALALGREKTGRRDDKMLFAALTRPQHFEPWLSALHSVECQLAGVYSLPLIAATFVSARTGKVPAQASQFLLVTLMRSGLRQTFFENGQLRFSRLTPLTGDSLEESSRACSVESARIHQYLIGNRMIGRNSILTTLVLVHPSQTASFRVSCRDSNELRFEFLDLLAEAKRLGLKTPLHSSQGSQSEVLFLHLLARKTPPQQFANFSARRLYRLWQTRFAINISGAAILLACLLFSGFQFYQLDLLRNQTVLTLRQAENTDRQYTAALKTLPAMPFGKDILRALIGRYDSLVKNTATPELTYRRISDALQQSPRVEINRIDWQVGGNVESAQTPGNAPPATGSPGNPGGALYVIADIYAELPVALKNDERALKGIIDTFVASLRKDDKLQVRILKLPFDVESTKILKSTEEATSSVEAPKFSLRTAQKL